MSTTSDILCDRTIDVDLKVVQIMVNVRFCFETPETDGGLELSVSYPFLVRFLSISCQFLRFNFGLVE